MRKNNTTVETLPMNDELEATGRGPKIAGDVVTRSLVVKSPKSWGSAEVTLEVSIDFTGVTHQQLLEWASRTKAIDLQRALRACDLAFVQDLASRGTLRRKAVECGIGFTDPQKAAAQARSMAELLTAEQKAQLIRALQESLNL